MLNWRLERKRNVNLTKSQIQAISIILRDNGASRSTLVEEGVHQRCLFSLVDNEICEKSALNVYTLTNAGSAAVVEHKIQPAVAWTKGPNPKPTGLEKYLDAPSEVLADCMDEEGTNMETPEMAAERVADANRALVKSVAAAVKKMQAARAPKPAKVEKQMALCLCGCKAMVKGSFAMGHDARLHGQVVRAKKENAQVVVSERAAAWLATKPWAVDGYKVSQ